MRPPERETLDPAAFRRVLGQFTTGVTVLTARAGPVVHGMTANAVTSASLEPLLVVCAIDRRARMLELVGMGGRFAINILAAGREGLARRFAGTAAADAGEEATIRFWPTAPDEPPILVGAIAAVRCDVERQYDAGDHVLVLGRVTELYGSAGRDEPLVFFRGRYRRLRSVPGGAQGPVEELLPEGLRLHYDEW
jgi:flavin reductase (DIM6/NTAB) family NADH-FMN oxidoreductase RutF